MTTTPNHFPFQYRTTFSLVGAGAARSAAADTQRKARALHLDECRLFCWFRLSRSGRRSQLMFELLGARLHRHLHPLCSTRTVHWRSSSESWSLLPPVSLSLSQGSNAHISSSSRPVCPVLPPPRFSSLRQLIRSPASSQTSPSSFCAQIWTVLCFFSFIFFF